MQSTNTKAKMFFNSPCKRKFLKRLKLKKTLACEKPLEFTYETISYL